MYTPQIYRRCGQCVQHSVEQQMCLKGKNNNEDIHAPTQKLTEGGIPHLNFSVVSNDLDITCTMKIFLDIDRIFHHTRLCYNLPRLLSFV